MTTTRKVIIGDATRGYTTFTVNVASTGRITLDAASIHGNKTLAKNAVAALREGSESVMTSGGDELPINFKS